MPVFRFNKFEVITARREIVRDGELLPVEPTVYDLLVYLPERAGLGQMVDAKEAL